MKRIGALAPSALLVALAAWFVLAGSRPSGPAGPAAELPVAEPERLTTRVVARLDEIGQAEDDWNDQKTAVAKAGAALEVARRESEIADLTLREYEEGILPQEQELAAAEAGQAEAEYRTLADRADGRRVPPAPANAPGRDGPEPKSATVVDDDPALVHAKLARDQARSRRDVLIRFTRPRKLADLRKEVERARAELALKKSALAQEQADLDRLARQLKEGALTADERRALTLMVEAGKETRGARLSSADRAAALWARAEKARAEKIQADARARIQKALEARP